MSNFTLEGCLRRRTPEEIRVIADMVKRDIQYGDDSEETKAVLTTINKILLEKEADNERAQSAAGE